MSHATLDEKRQHAARHGKQQRHDQVNPGIETDPLTIRKQTQQAGIEQQVTAEQQHDLGQNPHLLPLPYFEYRIAECQYQPNTKHCIGRGCPVQWHITTGQQQHACRQPRDQQQQQWHAAQCLNPGPVFHSG